MSIPKSFSRICKPLGPSCSLPKQSLLQVAYRLHNSSAHQETAEAYARDPTPIERATLAFSSAFTAIADPTRQDAVATLAETTSTYTLPLLRSKMLSDPTGRRILRTKPLVSSKTLDLPHLRSLPPGTFGREYMNFLDGQGVSPDTREPIRYIQNPELSYILTRYRQSHDFYHTLANLGVSVPEELAIKYFEFVQTGLPMTLLSSLVGPLRLTKEERRVLFDVYVPWAVQCGGKAKFLMNVYWEEWMDEKVDVVRKELGIIPAPKV
ncbi:Ubiquinone biosynthesis protein [Rhizophlyctis rosea]|uniref:4-hydroxy-3-methoxy-5-polyprenylbenzoate decarboxylase n=1 Tax=Rhizophlyctis rosea TaxID=64517 RepID=A0AAD5SHM9_9FUNG|nr:Ubiquinone biosynthesis protein [Rhizophlyctis rosea]